MTQELGNYLTGGSTLRVSADFPGHENRLAEHARRIRNHTCECNCKVKCKDCIKRAKE